VTGVQTCALPIWRADFGPEAKRLIVEHPETIRVSVASVWEAAIKVGIGKLALPYDLERDLPSILDDNGFELLSVSIEDAAAVVRLEPVHKDPFDRIQAVQARRRDWQVISRDPVFEAYGLRRVW